MFVCILFLSSIHQVFAVNHPKDLIYTSLTRFQYCVAYNTKAGYFGCSSKYGGNHGSLRVITEEKEWNEWSSIDSNKKKREMIALNENLITKSKLIQLNVTQVAGVIILGKNRSFLTEGLSSESKFFYINTSMKYNSGRNESWNNPGLDFYSMYLSYPLVLLTEPDEQQQLLECYKKGQKINVSDTSSCGVHINVFMFSRTLTSSKCLEISKYSFVTAHTFCQILQASNIHAYLSINKVKSPNVTQKTILITARMDFRSMYYGNSDAVGVESELSSIVIWLSVLKAVNQSLNRQSKKTVDQQLKHNFLFSLFDAESWDHMGSSGMAYKLKNKSLHLSDVNFTHENIHFVLDIGQMALFDQQKMDQIWVHSDSQIYSNITKNEIDNMVNLLKKAGSIYGVMVEKVDQNIPLPPFSSLHGFLNSDLKYPSVYLADFHTTLFNQFYHDAHDDIQYVTDHASKNSTKTLYKILSDRACTIATSILEMAGIPDNETRINSTEFEKHISSMIYCFTENMSCNLLSHLFPNINRSQHKKHAGVLRRMPKFVADSGDDSQSIGTTLPTYVIVLARVAASFTGVTITGTNRCLPQDEIISNMQNRLTISFNTSTGCVLNAPISISIFSSKQLSNWNTSHDLFTESGWEKVTLKIFHYPSTDVMNTLTAYAIFICSLMFLFNWMRTKYHDSIFPSI